LLLVVQVVAIHGTTQAQEVEPVGKLKLQLV